MAKKSKRIEHIVVVHHFPTCFQIEQTQERTSSGASGKRKQGQGQMEREHTTHRQIILPCVFTCLSVCLSCVSRAHVCFRFGLTCFAANRIIVISFSFRVSNDPLFCESSPQLNRLQRIINNIISFMVFLKRSCFYFHQQKQTTKPQYSLQFLNTTFFHEIIASTEKKKLFQLKTPN